MGEILTAAQMRAIEKTAMDSGQVSGRTLMERAGAGVVDAALAALGDVQKCNRHAVVLCGPGNNGGDGFVIARILSEKGWQVEVFFYGKVDRLPPDARHMHDLWTAKGAISPMSAAADQGVRPTILFDAMFGIGISRPIPVRCAAAFAAVRQRPAREPDMQTYVVAVDCPSGFDVDSGRMLVPEGGGAEQSASFLLHQVTDLCVTFHALKLGHYLTPVAVGRPVIVDIGLPRAVVHACIPDQGTVQVPPDPDARRWLRLIAGVGAGGHKYQRGHVLVLGGGIGQGGAGRLAARAALRVGAGLVTLAVPPEAIPENAAQLNAIMLREVGNAQGLEQMLSDRRLGVVCMGPGMGVGHRTREMVLTALRITGADGRRVVLDADALSSFADEPEVLFAACHSGVVITPHEGEFARLFPDLSERVRSQNPSGPNMGKVEAALTAAQRLGATILLKGEATVLADQRGASAIHPALYDRAAPWLGTAGAGDVLAGLIAGLSAHEVAQNHAPIDLAAAAAWLHVECARTFGPGLIAEDLPEQLPAVFRNLGF